MILFAHLRRLPAILGMEPDRRSVAANVQRLDELRRLLASDLAEHRIEPGHA